MWLLVKQFLLHIFCVLTHWTINIWQGLKHCDYSVTNELGTTKVYLPISNSAGHLSMRLAHHTAIQYISKYSNCDCQHCNCDIRSVNCFVKLECFVVNGPTHPSSSIHPIMYGMQHTVLDCLCSIDVQSNLSNMTNIGLMKQWSG